MNKKGVQTNQEMTNIGFQTYISYSAFSIIMKDQSMQFNGIVESIF